MICGLIDTQSRRAFIDKEVSHQLQVDIYHHDGGEWPFQLEVGPFKSVSNVTHCPEYVIAVKKMPPPQKERGF